MAWYWGEGVRHKTAIMNNRYSPLNWNFTVISKIGYNSNRMFEYSWTYGANYKLDRLNVKVGDVPSLCRKNLLTSRGVIL